MVATTTQRAMASLARVFRTAGMTAASGPRSGTSDPDGRGSRSGIAVGVSDGAADRWLPFSPATKR